MTPEQYKKLRSLFQAAMEFPADERTGMAEKLCQGDAELLTDLLTLLRAAEQPTHSLDRPIAQLESHLPHPVSVPALTGLVIDRFRIVRPLGSGGMGKVFEAIDRQTGRVIAIKLIQTSGAFSEHQRMRFLKEARNVAALLHPNIVEVYDIGQVQGHLYMVMEYLEGRSLHTLIQSTAPIHFLSMLRIMSQIAKALAFAHSKGVVHGDIKPDNIMVLGNGAAKLVDFGLARQQNGFQNTLIPGGGTLAYMAPEMFGMPNPTVASDIWSTGVTLFECLTGKRPFLNADEARYSPHPLIVWDSPLASQLNSLIAQTLVTNPAKRLRDAGKLATELESFCQENHSPTRSALIACPENEDQKRNDYEIYELPNLGFRSHAEGTLQANSGSFRWPKWRRLLLARRDHCLAIILLEDSRWSSFLKCGLMLGSLTILSIFDVRALPLIGVASLGLVLLVAFTLAVFSVVLYILATLCLLLGALNRAPLCHNCRLAMRRASSWTRFVKDKAEVVYGQSDCMAALKHGLWQEAAKLLVIHGRESVSEYANNFISPLRFRLDFFECDNCYDHTARLIAEDRDEDDWKLREVYYEAYWRGSLRRFSLLAYLSNVFAHGPRTLAEALRLKMKPRSILIPAVVGVLLAGVLIFAFLTSARHFRYLLKQDKVCYGDPNGVSRSFAWQPRPFNRVRLRDEKDIQGFLQHFTCYSRTVAYSDCEIYCTAR